MAETAESELAAANERLLVRLGFDLHDGPLQQVYVLAPRMSASCATACRRPRARHRARARQLRRSRGAARRPEPRPATSPSLEPRSLLQEPFPAAVRRGLATMERRTGIETSVTLAGGFDAMTDSQRIALLRVLQEALSNIRQHSGARTARVSLVDDGAGVRMEVEDDGHGFEQEVASPEPESRDGIGLVGMRERMRLLGGLLELTSRPGPARRRAPRAGRPSN